MSFTTTETVFLEKSLGKDDFNTKEGRQKVTDVFTKETGQKFDPDRIHTWFRNHKKNKLQGESV